MTDFAVPVPPTAVAEHAVYGPEAHHRLSMPPRALLLDFGGVIILTSKKAEGRRELAVMLENRLRDAGVQLPAEQLEAALVAGATALKHWKHASSRRREPHELAVSEILGEFYFGELPEPARTLLTGDGAELLSTMSTTLTEHTIRPGVRELISYAHAEGIALGVVSNAHSGRSHRRILAELGIADAFGVQIYSDEAGIRKPHPGMIARAASALGTEPSQCWYVGDTLDRDLLAGRRSGAGAVVLTRSQHTDEPPFSVRDAPEAIVEDPAALLELVRSAVVKNTAAGTGSSPVPSQPQNSAGSAEQVARYRGAAGNPSGTSRVLPNVQNQAILLDHGGVVSHSVKPEVPFIEAGETLEAVLRRAGAPVEPGRGLEIVREAHEQYKTYKNSRDEDSTYLEIAARQYWGDFTLGLVSRRQRQALLAEAELLQMALYRSKSVKTQREGIGRLLQFCQESQRRVVVVSNTVCGTGVRSIIRGYGLGSHIAGWVCSDEFGLKKPHPAIFEYALQMAGVKPEHAVMVGDKPFNDAYGAMGVGIGRRVITRGGSGSDEQIADGLNDGWITDVVDHPGQIPELLT